MADSKGLKQAFKDKADEFYTQLVDIELELKHYKNYFEGKIVFCNCDDPYESNFFKYFAINFNYLKLKKLIATCYDGSSITGEQLSLFDFLEEEDIKEKKTAYKIEISEVEDLNGDGAVDLFDVELLLKNKKNVLTKLKGNGDFRSKECIDLLKESDIVVTNPPFSLFREYVDVLMKYNKKFLIIGNQNAITYKEFFPYLMNNQIWLGCSIHSGDREFRVPDSYEIRSKSLRVDEQGRNFVRVVGVRWFTNLDYKEKHEELTLFQNYSPEKYPKLDNYDAININSTCDIPCDYDGIMAVPITFMDKYNPDQFEILGLSQKYGFGLKSNKFYDEYKEVTHEGILTGSSGKKTNGNPVMEGIPEKGNYYTNGVRNVHSLYGRIFIRSKKYENRIK